MRNKLYQSAKSIWSVHTDLKLYFCDIAGDVIRTRANFSTSSKSGRRQKEEMLKLDALPTELSGEL